jgi:hypothetical protein
VDDQKTDGGTAFKQILINEKLKPGKRDQKQLAGKFFGMKILCIFYIPTRGTCPTHMNLLD